MTYSISDYDLIFSMDTDKYKIHLAVLDREKVKQKRVLPHDPVNLFHYVRKTFPGQKGIFVYEAGPTGYGLYDFLTEQGETCVVAVPSMIPVAPGKRVKTNRLDACNLGAQLRTGDLNLVHVPDKKYRDLRHLVRLRLGYAKRLVATKNAIKGLFLFEGLQFPDGKWSMKVISQLEQLKYRPAVEFKLKQLLKSLEFYREQELKTIREIKQFCGKDEEINRCIGYLRTVPGVGWVVSTYTLAALGGYKHLTSAKSTSGFFGLGPRENSTGDRVKKGEITAVGDPSARKIIVQASWVAIRKDLELKLEFHKVYCRHNEQVRKQKAIVAASRKLICRIHAVLRDQRPFEKRLRKTQAA